MKNFSVLLFTAFLILITAISIAVFYKIVTIQYQQGLSAGEWKGKAETYQSIMDNQVATMKALGK